jgi:hypothetical protein
VQDSGILAIQPGVLDAASVAAVWRPGPWKGRRWLGKHVQCNKDSERWLELTASLPMRTAGARKDSDPAAWGSYSTTPRNGNRVNGNHLGICLSSSRKNGNFSYLGPGGLDSVFYLPCTV